ncbi:porin [Paraburkholderia sp. B3]|uniref:porin n=1 Tax=Paraburkholderia sp. B3 TaxID=3134791 RepID=UPI003982BBC2
MNDNIGAQYSIANSVKFESTNYLGFHFGALHGLGNDPGAFPNGRVWSIGAGYKIGPFTIAAAYDQMDSDPGAAALSSPAVTVPYGASLQHTYGLTPALALVGNYTYRWANTSGSVTESSSPKWNSVTLGVDYSLSKRTDVYFAGVYQHASGDVYDNGQGDVVGNATSIAGLLPASSTPNQVGVTAGMCHRF